MQFVNLHTHTYTNDVQIIEIVNQYPWEFTDAVLHYSIGIHPWHINENRLNNDLKTIEQNLQLKNCKALGECGLDKRIITKFEWQIEVFKMQVNLVKKTTKPIILHCVAAFNEIIIIKKEMQISNSMIIHGFSKNKHVAKSLLDNGFYLSFGKYLLQNSDALSVLNYIPEDRLFLETDTMNNTIFDVYEKAAHIKKRNLEDLKDIILTNYKSVFNNEDN